MKKRFVLIVAVCLILATLSACFLHNAPAAEPETPSEAPSETPSASIEPPEDTAPASVSPPDEPTPESAAPAAPPESADTPTHGGWFGQALQSSADAETARPVRGAIKNGVYTNAFSGIEFTLPDGWAVQPDDELAAIFGVSPDIYASAESWREAVDRGATLYDMAASEPGTANAIVFVFEEYSEPGGAPESNDQAYFDYLKQSLSSDASMHYTFEEMRTISLKPGDFKVLEAHEEDWGLSLYIYFRYENNYFMTIMLTLADNTGISVDDINDRLDALPD